MAVTLETIKEAAQSIAGDVVHTPVIHSDALSEMLGTDVFLKLENLQRTGAFKDRGALAKLKSLEGDANKKGVIAVSAGNHAQGVALHATRLGIPSTIVMPKDTPFTKVNRTQSMGARVVLHGDSFNNCIPHAEKLMQKDGLTFVHPFDDETVIAGQGTVGLELMETVTDLDAIICPIGGGGLIAGVATAAKAMRSRVEIFGVQAELFPSMYQAIHGLDPTAGGETIAEGIAVKVPGKITRPIVEEHVDGIFLASELAIESAIETMLDQTKTLVEGAAAAPLAALMEYKARFAGKKVALIVSGANISSRLLASILMRSLVRTGRITSLRISMSDNPGALASVATHIGETGGNIVEIVHQRLFYDVPVKSTQADIVVETRDQSHVREIVTRLTAAGFPCRQLGDTANG
jgi:threonine dehydratase